MNSELIANYTSLKAEFEATYPPRFTGTTKQKSPQKAALENMMQYHEMAIDTGARAKAPIALLFLVYALNKSDAEKHATSLHVKDALQEIFNNEMDANNNNAALNLARVITMFKDWPDLLEKAAQKIVNADNHLDPNHTSPTDDAPYPMAA